MTRLDLILCRLVCRMSCKVKTGSRKWHLKWRNVVRPGASETVVLADKNLRRRDPFRRRSGKEAAAVDNRRCCLTGCTAPPGSGPSGRRLHLYPSYIWRSAVGGIYASHKPQIPACGVCGSPCAVTPPASMTPPSSPLC